MGESDDLRDRVENVFDQSWDMRDGTVVPRTDDVKLLDGAVKLDGVVLYADLKSSSKLAELCPASTVAKVVRAYLHAMCRLISAHHGEVTSFDGDRVMGVFVEGSNNTNAATCALKMNYVVTEIIAPMARSQFKSIRESGFVVSHCVGVDRSDVLAVRAGQRGANDLIWIGRAPNMAAKLSEIRSDYYRSYVSESVYNRMLDNAKYRSSDKALMWERCPFTFADKSYWVYRSSWTWKP